MKIIQITAAYKPAYIYGGPTMSVAKLCECLGSWESGSPKVRKSENLKEKVDIHVFTTTANGKSELEVKANEKSIVDGVDVTYFKRLTKDHTHFSPALLWALRREILLDKKNPPPTPSKGGQNLVIHIHAWWNLVSVLSCAFALWYKVPVVLSPRGMLTSYTSRNRNSFIKNLIHRLMGKRLLKACHIHATSEQEKKDILSIVKPKSIIVIPNLVELDMGRQGNANSYVDKIANNEIFKHPVLPSLQGALVPIYRKGLGVRYYPFKLIFLSRIEEKKGLDVLFEALAKIEFNWTLTTAGSGNEEYINKLKLKAEKLKINRNINWVGQVNKEDKFELLAAHDLMVLTSHNENFANVVIECLSVGTPVLLSDQVGLADYVLTNDLGWITELKVDRIAETLEDAHSYKIKNEKIRIIAPALINENFNDEILVNKYIDLYQNVSQS